MYKQMRRGDFLGISRKTTYYPETVHIAYHSIYAVFILCLRFPVIYVFTQYNNK